MLYLLAVVTALAVAGCGWSVRRARRAVRAERVGRRLDQIAMHRAADADMPGVVAEAEAIVAAELLLIINEFRQGDDDA